MNENEIRGMLETLTQDIKALDKRRETLMTARAGLEALLSLEPGRSHARIRKTGRTKVTGQLVLQPKGRTQPRGVMSFRQAIMQVMRDSDGSDLHTSEILRRVNALGATTEAKDPYGVTDLVLYALRKNKFPVRKTDPRTWRWVGK